LIQLHFPILLPYYSRAALVTRAIVMLPIPREFRVAGPRGDGRHAYVNGSGSGDVGLTPIASPDIEAKKKRFVDAHLQGISNPAAFASSLQNSGKYGIDPDTGSKVPGYVASVASTIRGLRRFIPGRGF
jgi:hypothetical protein